MKLVLTVMAVLILLVVGVAVFVGLGVYNVSARVPHRNITLWFLEKVRQQSIFIRSKQIPTLPSENAERENIGFRHYHAMCRVCHGAPGHAQTEIPKGLYPKPPEYKSKNVQRWRDTEVYWIVENGIKMTGMPAFGPTRSKGELGGIVVFVRELPNLSAKEYQAMVEAGGFKEEGIENHHHGKGKQK